MREKSPGFGSSRYSDLAITEVLLRQPEFIWEFAVDRPMLK
ncbi:MAG: hypothetical protein ACE5NG_12600 [bacterium]